MKLIHYLLLCVFLLFLSAVAKSAQFSLHVWLSNAVEGPTPIFALIHATIMVATGIFLIVGPLPLFRSLPFIMSFISLVGTITLFLGATLALVQRDIERSLAYSTMSQLGYMMLALGVGSYQAALFHSIEPLVGYSPDWFLRVV
jgi:NAD(P)H-quinone oxidoreductase subunit 5